MSYADMRRKIITTLGDDRIKSLIETNTDIKFTGKRSGSWHICHGDANDRNASAGFHCESWVFHDFRGKVSSIEETLGNGDFKMGFAILMKEAKLQPGEYGYKNGKIPEKDISLEEIIKCADQRKANLDVINANTAIKAFVDGCVQDMMGINYVHNTIHWLENTRMIPRGIAAYRQVGLASDVRLAQLATDLKNTGNSIADYISEFKLRVSGLLVWPMYFGDEIHTIKFRGTQREFFTLSLKSGHCGWMGKPEKGDLLVYEGEFNLLQCDNKNGSPVNGIALGGSSSNAKDFKIIRELSPTMTVMADNDEPGRKMAQAIANIDAVRVIFPNDGKDADEFLMKGHSLKELMALVEHLSPSWEGLKEKIVKITNKAPSEITKRAATKEIIDALLKKGMLLHSDTGSLYFLEK